MLRTHTCGEASASLAGKEVTLCGWVHRRRDHGPLTFIDLRDRYGLTQVVAHEKETAAANADPRRPDRRARLHRAVPLLPREVLAAAAVPAAIQADPDGRRPRQVLPDRPLLPRRGPARRPRVRAHAALPRDELRRSGRRHGDARGSLHRDLPDVGARAAGEHAGCGGELRTGAPA